MNHLGSSDLYLLLPTPNPASLMAIPSLSQYWTIKGKAQFRMELCHENVMGVDNFKIAIVVTYFLLDYFQMD
jgi:hypothetical protein